MGGAPTAWDLLEASPKDIRPELGWEAEQVALEDSGEAVAGAEVLAGFQGLVTSIQILALPLTGCATLDTRLHLSVPLFPPCCFCFWF